MISSQHEDTPQGLPQVSPVSCNTGTKSLYSDEVNRTGANLIGLIVGYLYPIWIVGCGEKSGPYEGMYTGITKKYKDTGEIKHQYICSQKKDSPVGYIGWLCHTARRHLDKVFDVETKLFPGKKIEEIYPAHIVVSPPKTHKYYNDPKKMIRSLKEFLKSRGITRGTIVFHPARFSKKGRVLYRKYLRLMNTINENRLKEGKKVLKVRKIWDWWHNEGGKDSSILVKAPHFHVLAFQYVKEQKYNGWVIKKKDPIKGVDLKELKFNTLQVLKYILSHAGSLREGEKVLRGFGEHGRARKVMLEDTERETIHFNLVIGETSFGPHGIKIFQDELEEFTEGKEIEELKEGEFGPNYLRDDGKLRLYWQGEDTETIKNYEYYPLLTEKRKRYFPNCREFFLWGDPYLWRIPREVNNND